MQVAFITKTQNNIFGYIKKGLKTSNELQQAMILTGTTIS